MDITSAQKVSASELLEQRDRVRSRSLLTSVERRRSSSIRRHNANIRNLWACGVGAVISGDYFGWNSSLTAGCGGTLMFLCIVTVFYTLLTNAVAEMVTRVPQVGGAYTFAVVGCGRFWGFLVGVAETVKMIAAVGALLCSISDYAITSNDWLWHFLVWVVFLVPLVTLNAMGVVFSFQMGLTVASIVLLVVFYMGAVFVMDFTEYAEGDGWFGNDIAGVLQGFPFVLWFFLGIEELPLTIEEVADPVYDMPRAITGSMITLASLAALTVVLSCSVSPGTVGFITESAPLLAGYEAFVGSSGFGIDVLAVLTIIGLVCSLHCFVYFSGQIVYSMALDSLYPKIFAQVSKYETPAFALVLMSCLSLGLLMLLSLTFGIDGLVSVLPVLCLFVSTFSYIVQFFAFIQLRKNSKEQLRKYYSSPFGKPGAYLGITFGCFILISLIYLCTTRTEYMVALICGGCIFATSLTYYRIKLWPKTQNEEISNNSSALLENNGTES